jgi:hypothetical protein
LKPTNPNPLTENQTKESQVWEAYAKKYHNSRVLIEQLTVLSIVANEVLKDFPRNLPTKLGSFLLKIMEGMAEAMRNSKLEPIEGSPGQLRVQTSVKFEESEDGEWPELVSSATQILMSQSLVGLPFRLDFEGSLRAQEVVMLLAHLDGFMVETLRAVCRIRPEVLKKASKSASWEDIVECGGWEELLDFLSEKYSYEFGWMESIKNRISFLEEQFKLKLDIPSEDLVFIEKMENVRHVIVHNGGIVSKEYVSRTSESDLAIGTPVSITEIMITRLSTLTALLCERIYKQISVKFFSGRQATTVSVSVERIEDETVASEGL